MRAVLAAITRTFWGNVKLSDVCATLSAWGHHHHQNQLRQHTARLPTRPLLPMPCLQT